MYDIGPSCCEVINELRQFRQGASYCRHCIWSENIRSPPILLKRLSCKMPLVIFLLSPFRKGHTYLSQDLQDLNWLQELSSSPSAPSDAPFPLFLQQQQLEPASQSTAWQPSFPAATTSRTREPALLQPSFPAPAASLALRAQDLSIPSQAQQPGFPAAATSLLFQPRPITNPMQAQSSLSKHLSLQSRSPSPSATLRPTASLPQPTQPDMPILRSRLLPMDEVLERVRERSLGPQETSTAEPSQRDLSRSAPPSAAQVCGNPCLDHMHSNQDTDYMTTAEWGISRALLNTP